MDMSILTEKVTWRREPSAKQRQKRTRETLTAAQQANVRRAISALRLRYGSAKVLAGMMGISAAAFWKARAPSRQQSPRLALVVARVACVSVDDVLTGAWPAVCQHCGGTGYE
jgi:hypothetical protein